jgi:biotin carboxyl carrier protein
VTFEIEVNGHRHVVRVEPVGAADGSGGSFRVAVEGADLPTRETWAVEARRTDLGISMLYTDDHRTADVAVTARAAGETLVQLPHVDLPVVVDGRRSRRRGGETGGTGEQRVSAPMPGRVLRVLVMVGDEGSAGQAVVVVEAMKMENELRVHRAGRVREVLVSEAASVETGRLLIVVE